MTLDFSIDSGSTPFTRWGTWINACEYYSDNFLAVKQVINSLEAQDTRAIEIAQEMFSADDVQGKLAYIKANFNSLPSAITLLQERGVTIEQAAAFVRATQEALENLRGEVGEIFKLKSVLDKNTGYKVLCSVILVLTGEDFSVVDIEEELLSPSDLAYLKYAPLASVDVERSFSMYKNVLADSRRSFTFKNLRMVTVIYCNTF
ncbi:uncharacterized protein [Anabrus simplex]|uniref:uncharacterized protein n=1 Tax=Anabrus simplex TaxID=316456 RepID=UPI0035A295C4